MFVGDKGDDVGMDELLPMRVLNRYALVFVCSEVAVWFVWAICRFDLKDTGA